MPTSRGRPAPDWEELGTAFRVIFHQHPAVLEHSRADVPVSVPANDRQRWFLEQHEASNYCSISEKTAKRDIAGLKRKGLIEFVGAPKNGFYRIMEEWELDFRDYAPLSLLKTRKSVSMLGRWGFLQTRTFGK